MVVMIPASAGLSRERHQPDVACYVIAVVTLCHSTREYNDSLLNPPHRARPQNAEKASIYTFNCFI